MAKDHAYTRLSADSNELSVELEPGIASLPRPTSRSHISWLSVNIVLIISNLIFVGLWLHSSYNERDANCVRPQLINSPGRNAIQYEKRRLYRDTSLANPLAGPPRKEHDDAWKKIIEPMMIKVSADELATFNEGDETVGFKDGSGYIAEMALYHELHCIKRIRHAFHREYYYPGINDTEWAREEAHVDHCLEYWREAAICRGDVTMITFFWREDGPTSRVYSDHECANWNDIDSWARKRMVTEEEMSLLEKPLKQEPIPYFVLGDH